MKRSEFTNFDMSTFDHRLLVLSKIKKYAPFETLVDIGCGSGADLFLIGDAFPEAKLTGVDKDIETAQKFTSANLIRRDLREWVKETPEKSFDIVLSNGVLIYFDIELLNEFLRIAKRVVILSERDQYKPRNPKFEDYFNSIGISAITTKITNDIRHSWGEDGYIYEIVK